MNRNHVSEFLQDYVDGDLSSTDRRRVEQHIAQCSECHAELVSIQNLIAELKALPRNITPPADVFKGIESKLEAVDQSGLALDGRKNGRASLRQGVVLKSNYLRIAAAILVMLAGGVITWLALRTTTEDTQSNVQATITLPDSSKVVARVVTEVPTIAQVKPEQSNRKPKGLRKSLLQLESSRSIVSAKQIGDTTNHQKHLGVGQLRGVVRDAQTGEKLPLANVLVVGTGRGGVTDSNGEFVVEGIPQGEHTLKFSLLGYAADTARVKVSMDSTAVLAFSLNQAPIQTSGGLTVTGVRPLVEKSATNSVRIVSSEEIVNLPQVRGVQDALDLQAGVVKFGSQLFLRGGSGDGQLRTEQSKGQFNTEQYNRIYENEFLEAEKNPLSTFSIDVDAASYSNVRRFINDGQLPPKDAVRIEEMINYFTYDYPQPKDNRPFSITTEVAACPWNSANTLLLVGLQGKKVPKENIPPGNLVFLLDVSGSMDMPNKLPLVKAAFRLLVGQLRPQDKVSIVVYAGNAGLVLPSTPGDEKERILEAIDNLQAGGSTAGGQGIVLAYNIAKENFNKEGNNRVILATDGDFNVGVSSDGELVRLIEERRNQGIYLSVLGFGQGNYKDSKMEQLADKGNGNYAYIDNIQEARKVFVGQLAGTLFTIAKDVKIQIEFNPVNVKAYRLIGYENRLLAKEDFNDDRKDAGELGSGHSVTALYEIVTSDGMIGLQAVDSLKYQHNPASSPTFFRDELLTLKLRYKMPSDTVSKFISQTVKNKSASVDETSDNFRFASVVAQWGMLLRESKYKGDASYEGVLSLARKSLGNDQRGYRSELIRLVEACKDIPPPKER